MSIKKNINDEAVYKQILLMVKELELLYNLSNGLSKKKRQDILIKLNKVLSSN
jgi:hypothetical protein